VWMAQGAVVLAATMFILGGLTLEIAPSNVIFPIIISGFGVTSIFVPMTTFSMATVSREQMGDATGITSLVRNLGGSVGISVLTALITRGTQAHEALLIGHLTPYDYGFQTRLQTLQKSFGGGPGSQTEAYALINQTVQQQAALWSYVDQFRNLFIICLLLVPLVFLFQRISRPPVGAAAGAH